MKAPCLIILLALALATALQYDRLSAQHIYLPAGHEVYSFLKRMEARHLLGEYRDAARPLSRLDIARHLRSVDAKIGEMTSVERDTYEFLKGEFHYEIATLAGDPEPSEIRWHLISTGIPQGVMHLDPVGSYSYTDREGESTRLRSQGIKWYGYIYRSVGFYFNFLDYREAGGWINRSKVHTPEPGVVIAKEKQGAIEYNTTEAQLTLQLGEFQFSLEKMQNVWGLGRRGNLAFSMKSPSYPQIKMRVPITDWMDFVYIHADLKSNVLDSSRSYRAHSSAITDFFRPVDRLKYLAAHQIEFTPVTGIDISLGESIVYSDRGPQLLYLIPVMFFKSGEHYNRDTDNAQFFGNLDVNLIRNINLFASIFLDEFTLDDLTDPLRARNQIGFTLGAQVYDLPIRNVELLVEYSRLNPWVYSHKFTAANFTNNGYDLGHWIGQNADNLYYDLSYRPLRALSFGVTYEVYRKGGLKDIAFQYRTPSQPFLYAPLREERSLGAYLLYQVVRDGFLEARVRSRTLSDEALGKHHEREFEWWVGLRYGIW